MSPAKSRSSASAAPPTHPLIGQVFTKQIDVIVAWRDAGGRTVGLASSKPDPTSGASLPRVRVPSRPVCRFLVQWGHPQASLVLRVWRTPAGQWYQVMPGPPEPDVPDQPPLPPRLPHPS